MSFKEDLFEFLIALAPLATKVGNRIYPQFAPTTAVKPYLTFAQVSGNAEHKLDPDSSATSLNRDRYEFTVWGDTDKDCTEVKNILQTALDGITTLLDGTTSLRRAFMEDVVDSFENPSDGTNDVKYRQTMDFIFWYYRV